jgi:hypothetical protein
VSAAQLHGQRGLWYGVRLRLRLDGIPQPSQRNWVLVQRKLIAMVRRWLRGKLGDERGNPMTLLTKKVTGLGLVLLGGLATAHGAAGGRAWEALLGLLVVIVGAALLAMKIVRRNMPSESRQPQPPGMRTK